jgi:thioredoxin reductase (NADPH)
MPGETWKLNREPYYLGTSMPGVFAAGDVRHGSIKRVASAVGTPPRAAMCELQNVTY